MSSSVGHIAAGLIVMTALYAINKGVGYYRRLKYKVSGVKIAGSSSNVIELLVNFMIYNPTPATLTLNGIKANYYLNGTFIGVTEQQFEQAIAGKATTTVMIPVSVDAGTTSGALLKAVIAGDKAENWVLGIDSLINVSGVNIPLKFNYQIKEFLK